VENLEIVFNATGHFVEVVQNSLEAICYKDIGSCDHRRQSWGLGMLWPPDFGLGSWGSQGIVKY